MTNKELQQLLKLYPDNVRVFTRGYEDGYVDPELYFRKFALEFHSLDDWYYGPHVDADRAEEKHEIVAGLYIG